MRRSIFIFHGSYGHPKENWFPWIKEKLEKLGHTVFIPRFPVPKGIKPGGHHLDEWLNEFDKYYKTHEESYL